MSESYHDPCTQVNDVLNHSSVINSSHRRCPHCGGLVVVCQDRLDRAIEIDPTPIYGGDLIINAIVGRIVIQLSPGEAAAAARKRELGFIAHTRVCMSSEPSR